MKRKIDITLGGVYNMPLDKLNNLFLKAKSLSLEPFRKGYDFRTIKLIENEGNLFYKMSDAGGKTVCDEGDIQVRERQLIRMYSLKENPLRLISEIEKIVKDGKTIEKKL